MKNIKRACGIAVLIAILSSFFVACSLSTNQEYEYLSFIGTLQATVKNNKLEAKDMEKWLEDENKEFAVYGFRVTDKQAGTDVEKGTDHVALKKRFKAEKLKKA